MMIHSDLLAALSYSVYLNMSGGGDSEIDFDGFVATLDKQGYHIVKKESK